MHWVFAIPTEQGSEMHILNEVDLGESNSSSNPSNGESSNLNSTFLRNLLKLSKTSKKKVRKKFIGKNHKLIKSLTKCIANELIKKSNRPLSSAKPKGAASVDQVDELIN